MKMRMGLLVFVGVFTFLSTVSFAAKSVGNPNIVIILSDDYGWGSVGCYGADTNLIRTPNLDRLAREGRRFTDANTTSSVCTPTRYSMMTGRYCWRSSLKHFVLGTQSPLLIEPSRLNLASLLKKHGYATAAIGKWHLGYGTKGPMDFTKELKPGPLELGFDYHFGLPANHGDNAGIYVENHRVFGLRSDKLTPRDQAGTNFQGTPFLGLDAPRRVDVDVMPFLTTKVVEWLGKQSKAKPFFLYYTPVAVHNPVTPSPKTQGTSRAGKYGDWIHELDESVGRVLDALDQKGFTKNTLVLFTSDNGAVNKPTGPGESAVAIQAGLKVCGPFRGGKQDVWEGGFRVPYVVRWPGHVPAGTTCDEMLSLADTLATVAAIVNEPLPPASAAAEDSYNMLPAWLGKKYNSPIRPDMIVHSAGGNFAIRQGRWKWIEGKLHPQARRWYFTTQKDQTKPQLYNLAEDKSETSNALAQNAELAKQLEELLNRYRDQGFSRAGNDKLGHHAPATTALANTGSRSQSFPQWYAPERKVRLAPDTAPFPVGLFVICHRNVLDGEITKESPLTKIAARDYVQAIAFAITWDDLQPTSAPLTMTLVARYLKNIEAASRFAGRDVTLPAFFKFYPSKLPGWASSGVQTDKPLLVTNKMGMSCLRLPARVPADGQKISAADVPISTDHEYFKRLTNLVKLIAGWLGNHDPDGRRVPLFHFVGPAMTSNQMRPPVGGVFPNEGPDKLGAGWTKAGHLAAWRSMARVLATQPGLARRCWVFNFTNLPRTEDETYWLTTEEQASVYRAVQAAHPAGPDAVICKTESLTVSFDRRAGVAPAKAAEGGTWRNQMFNQPDASPYRFIAEQKCHHGWENWAGFNPERDARAPNLYPLDRLIENSLYLDLDEANPGKPQGTLWVEIWPQEAIRVENIERLDGARETLEAGLQRWDVALRAEFERALNARSIRTND